MNKDRIWTLLSRKLSGEATGAELNELTLLLSQNPETELPVQLVEEYWDTPAEADPEFLEATYLLHLQRLQSLGHEVEIDHHDDTNTGLLNVDEHFFWKKHKSVMWSTGVLAALIVAILFFYPKTTQPVTLAAKTGDNEVSTKNGSRSKITLPDGTQVWLNSDSKLLYDDSHFGETAREVTLSGEAYFDVVKSSLHPFIIHTAKINIKVLGTAFNVKAYPEDRQTETSLIRGRIEVTINNRPNDKIILSPNEKLVVENNEVISRKTKAIPLDGRSEHMADTVPPQVSVSKLVYYPADNSITETGWVYNRLIFRDESFEEVALKMERWYNTEIEIKGEELKNLRITGAFENENVNQALDALKLSFPFKYKQDGNKIIIYD